MLDRSDVRKIGAGYRFLSFFISLCCVMALMGVIAYGRDEGVTIGIVLISLAPLLLLYVFVPIVVSGYPPRILLWVTGKR